GYPTVPIGIPQQWRRSICCDGCSVGIVSVYPESGDDRCRAEISYAVAADYWGRGIATRGMKLALSQVFHDLTEVLRLQALVDVNNRASQRVLEKAGFRQEGWGELIRFRNEDGNIAFMHNVRVASSVMKELQCIKENPEIAWTSAMISSPNSQPYLGLVGKRVTSLPIAFAKGTGSDHHQGDLHAPPVLLSICVNGHSFGFVSVVPGSGDDRCCADIRYAAATDYWGQGIATRAVKLALSQVFQDLTEVQRLQAFVDINNRASQRVLDKAWFTWEG
ncbi:hypothetical protein CRG98_034701, partial [Punica granatum]